jgi:PrgI family protein
MQFQVPQFIDTEDKIVGPLSLRQFAYVAAAGVVSGILYFMTAPWLWVIGSIIVFGIAIALGFVKIEGRPFANVIVSAFNFYWRPQTYVWQAEHKTVVASKEPTEKGAGFSLEKILEEAAPKKRIQQVFSASRPPSTVTAHSAPAVVAPITRESVSTGLALHKTWENVQTGSKSDKDSDKQFLERRMEERYQIFKRVSGDRAAAKRVDYR